MFFLSPSTKDNNTTNTTLSSAKTSSPPFTIFPSSSSSPLKKYQSCIITTHPCSKHSQKMDIDRPHYRSNSNSNSTSTNTTTSELFICFTSRLSSSSSMKISSKSILSPGRCSREPTSQISLSTSLSRRLRTNGSMKGGQGQASPMFPSTKKRGCYENPEPSSPKVTCIGQVRVKTKKQGRKMRISRSQRQGGEVSFRRVDNNNNNTRQETNSTRQENNSTHQENVQQECLQQRNQKWVHFPLTICEALRAFSSEFNCFIPCRSSCLSSEKDNKQEKISSIGGNVGNGNVSSNGSRSCGAVFARWLVAVQEGEHEVKTREIELVVGEEDEEKEEDFTERRRSYRRHVFEEIEFSDEKFGGGDEKVEEDDEEGGRVSICVPPKNALLLMRCRSDPVKMAALANKFWEPSVSNDGEVNEAAEEQEDGDNIEGKKEEMGSNICDDSCVEVEEIKVGDQEMVQSEDLIELVACENDENEAILEEQEDGDGEVNQESRNGIDGVQEEQTEIQETLVEGLVQETEEIQENEENMDQESEKIQENEEGMDQETEKTQENEEGMVQENEYIQENENVNGSINQELEEVEAEVQSDEQNKELAIQQEIEATQNSCNVQEQNQEQQESLSIQEPEPDPEEGPEPEDLKTQEEETGMKSKERESQQSLLPDCLLLMMCEPKLSMEVSKETWVCSTDFIRWLPEPSRPPQVKKKDGGDQPKKRLSIDGNSNYNNNKHSNSNSKSNNPPLQGNFHQPPRSSCYYPGKPPARAAGAESMTKAIEKKLVGVKAYEPFMLKRCKSEPMRSAAKLAPEACFWNNRKLEPHPPAATLGVGAAGVGC
ncbi:uncharacterized protein LOC126668981 [Mercurialis annua]|uniref:uncharacterized protein LOC126668981 n=1 Tax=Mercurialis annua TaxID=3986 RepID=UPI00215FFA20|nr:uncharacterized protein LOC126668981 [Mercurialis annua]